MNLKQMLEQSAKRYREKTAIAMADQKLSYAQLDEASNKVANALRGMGVSKGDRVAMLLSNSPEFVTVYFGVVKIGGIAVPLDVRYRLDELTSLFNNSQPKVLVSESPPLELVAPALSRFSYIEHVIDLNDKYRGQFHSYPELMAASSAPIAKVEVKPGDTAHVAYTSGPTVHPRGVMMSHQALVREAAISGKGFQQTDKDIVVLFALPMHHAFGLVVVMLTAISRGSTVIMLPGLSIKSLLELIEREKATIFMGVPFVHTLIVGFAETEGIHHDLSSIRLWGTAGAAMPANIGQKIRQYFGLETVDFWGMTESAAQVTCQSLNGAGKPGSVGKALPGWELKVVDSNGRVLPPNHPGEIIVRGPIMKGYYTYPQTTVKVIKDGWLYTGDIGRVDEDGELFLVGRRKGIIIVKGQNVYPSDIEEVLYTHPKVAEAVVAGFPDKYGGKRLEPLYA
jgi:long-chain acyl-CoA synthetase